ncbi:MAG TPA: hypothetical protein VFR86_17385, partial [Burkholderiaceae bacterium]|nr:hypothetical protein [Burkholderiaceae bacterium]
SQLIVELPASSAESHEARVTNALGMNTGSAVLKTLAPQTYTAAAIDQSGFAVSLIYDAERRALLLVNRNGGSNSLKRIAFNGSTWTGTPLIAADLWDVGLSQDGTTLLAAMTAGELRLLDPVTAAERSLIALGSAMSEDREWFLSKGLSVTSDAQVLLPLDASPGSPFKDLKRVDLRTGTVSYVNQASGYVFFYRGPLFGGPRDGSRFMGRQNSGVSSVEEIYYAVKYDAANGALSTTSKIHSPFDLRFADDGRLALISLDRVVDAGDDLHGLVRLPAADQADWLTVAGQIAPDGSRVYLLAYPKRGNADSAASGIKPRVYVLDSSTASADPAGLPVLGYFEIDQYPSGCVSGNYPYSCWNGLASTISADGNTLFFSGSLRTLVVPIAGTLIQPQASVRRAATWRFGAQR